MVSVKTEELLDGVGGPDGVLARDRHVIQPRVPDGFGAVVLDLVKCVCVPGESCLIFLPGIGEITDLYENLAVLEGASTEEGDEEYGSGGEESAVRRTRGGEKGKPGKKQSGKMSGAERDVLGRRFRLFVLHSSVPMDEQRHAFDAPDENTVNIYLASPIAESSVGSIWRPRSRNPR